MVRRVFAWSVIAVALLAYVVAVTVHLVHQPHEFGLNVLLKAIVGAAILLVLALPAPLVTFVLTRRLAKAHLIASAVWGLACVALGIWAAVSPI